MSVGSLPRRSYIFNYVKLFLVFVIFISGVLLYLYLIFTYELANWPDFLFFVLIGLMLTIRQIVKFFKRRKYFSNFIDYSKHVDDLILQDKST
ncbi:MAG: hypothetical protein ACTSQC_07460 [Candidatus Heimdallarchaeaceae archaeon]|nr:hypothetical protein [Candidatus Heimdallarchaeota archaeon]